MNITRREVFGALGGSAAAAAGVGALGPGLLPSSEAAEARGAAPALPWKYVALDPAATAERAYQDYYRGACMFGAFESIMGQLGERLGPPHATFPFAMMRYGKTGVMGWGTLCGALNGAAAAASLVSPDLDAFVHELFTWYEQTPLPAYEPKRPRTKLGPMPRSVSHSTLCHVSVTLWAKAAKVRTDSRQRVERCARLTGTVAQKSVALLNAQLAHTFAPTSRPAPETRKCQACHTRASKPSSSIANRKSQIANVQSLPDTLGRMACATCHRDIRPVAARHPEE